MIRKIKKKDDILKFSFSYQKGYDKKSNVVETSVGIPCPESNYQSHSASKY